MSVQSGPTFKRYAANGVTTVFAIPFLLIEPTDLMVTLNGVEVTSGFSLTGVGNPTSTATFTTPPAGDLLFLLMVPFERLTDYQENGDLLALTLNNDLDRVWQALKELRRDDSTALRTSPLEPEGIPNLPLAAQRASRVLAFDPSGAPVVSSLTIDELEQQPALATAAADAAVAAAGAASSSASASAASATASENSAIASAQAKDKAQQWAEEDEDVPVEPGLFSAKHWAAKSQQSVSGLDTRVTALESIGKPFTKEYVSAEQAITSGGTINLTHGLGAKPKLVEAVLICKTAEQGYSVGEEVSAHHDVGTSPYNFSVGRNSTTLRCICASNGIASLNSSGAFVSLTNANWRLVVRAWA